MIEFMGFVKKLIRGISPGRINFDFGNPDRTVLIAGAARSGTTYFTNLVNADNAFRYIFEPFHPEQCSYMHGLSDTPYLKPGDENEAYRRICDSIFRGKVHSRWVDKFNKKCIIHQRILKSIHMIVALVWIHTHFPAIPIIYILHNPLAVIASKLKIVEKYTDWFDLDLDELFQQSQLT